MDIYGQAWESAGDGGEICISYNFDKEKVKDALAKYAIDEPDVLFGFTSAELFLESYLPSVYREIDRKMKREACGDHYRVEWMSLEQLAEEVGYDG